jgi:hypothetical protein
MANNLARAIRRNVRALIEEFKFGIVRQRWAGQRHSSTSSLLGVPSINLPSPRDFPGEEKQI